jgi:hypothetical protein
MLRTLAAGVGAAGFTTGRGRVVGGGGGFVVVVGGSVVVVVDVVVVVVDVVVVGSARSRAAAPAHDVASRHHARRKVPRLCISTQGRGQPQGLVAPAWGAITQV